MSEAGYKPSNPIVETANIIQLQRSANPEQEAMGQILRMVQLVATQVESLRFDVRQVQAQQVANTNALTVAVSQPPHVLRAVGISTGTSTAAGHSSLGDSAAIAQKSVEAFQRST